MSKLKLQTEINALAILSAEREELNALPVIDSQDRDRLKVLDLMIAHFEEVIEAQGVSV